MILLSVAVLTTGIVRAASLTTSTETESGADSAKQNASQPESGAGEESQQNPSGEAPANAPAAKQGGGTQSAQGPAGRPYGSTRPGKYRYRTTSTNTEGEKQTRESGVTIEDGSKTPQALRQIIKPETTQEQRESGFGGFQQEIEWRADGLYEIGNKGTTPQGETGCNWDPPRLSLRLPLKVGLEWKSDSSCTSTVTYQGQQQTFKNHTVTSSKVTGTQQVTVAGQTIEVFVIEERSTAKTEGSGFSNSAEGTGTRLFSAKHGLDVKWSGKSTSDFRGQKREFSTEREILNLDPE